MPVLAGSESVPPAPWLPPQLEHFCAAYLVLFVVGNRSLRVRKGLARALSQLGYCRRAKLPLSLTSAETVGLLGTGAQDGHLDFHAAPELWQLKLGKY